MYSIQVKCFGKWWASKGETLEAAISNMKIPNAKGMSIWKVVHNGNVKEKVVGHLITSRLLNSRGVVKEVAMKQFKLLFE